MFGGNSPGSVIGVGCGGGLLPLNVLHSASNVSPIITAKVTDNVFFTENQSSSPFVASGLSGSFGFLKPRSSIMIYYNSKSWKNKGL